MTRATHTLSVCMPVYNGAAFLPTALEALLAQSYAPLEILLLDDGSTDDSLDILADYERREPRIRVLRHEANRGVVEAFLGLVEAARGSHIFLSSVDDTVLPGLLEKSMDLLEQHPSAGFCCSLSRWMDAEGVDRGVFPSPVLALEPAFIPPERIPKLLPAGFLGWFVLGNTVVWSVDALRVAGRRCARLGPYLDGFMSQVIALERGVCFVPEALGNWRVWDESYSGQIRNAPEWQRGMADGAYRLMTEDYRHLFPSGFADRWRREVEVQLELDERESAPGPGKLARLLREARARRRHGLGLMPAVARRVRVRRDALRRRRLGLAGRDG